MKVGRALLSLLALAARVVLALILVSYIGRLGNAAYDFGYRVFSEPPVSSGQGIDVTVNVPVGASAMEIGRILEKEGLIRDARLFYVQETLSGWRGKLQPGTYTLRTTMTSEEMMEEMAGQEEEEEGEGS